MIKYNIVNNSHLEKGEIMEFVSIDSVYDALDIENVIKEYKAGKVKAGDIVEIKGSIHRIRLMNGFAFVILRTPRRLFQCVHEDDKSGFDIAELHEEDCVVVKGEVVPDERREDLGFELHLRGYRKLSSAAEALPIVINKKKLTCSPELLFDDRAITLRNPHERAILKIADGVMYAFREFLHGEGFTEFVAPKIVQAGAEGGADMFELDYFGQKAFLAQSPQMYKQMMVGVFTKVFTMSPVFRAEKHSTSRHINEFQGLDLEMGYLENLDDLMAVEARMMKKIFSYLNENYQLELQELGVTLPEIGNIPKIKFMDAKELVKNTYNRPYRDMNDLEPDEERLIGKYFMEKFGSPFVFVTHYPSVKRPFYAMDDPEDPTYTLSFDLLLNGTEVTTGGRRIHDYHEQVAKMEARGMNIDDFSDYLMMHKYGLPPHGGLGIGLERLVSRILDLDNIKYATAFPRDMNRLNP